MALMLSLAAQVHAADDALRAQIGLLATKRIYFAYQSVGANILQGVSELAREADAPLRIVEAPKARAVGAGTFGHFFVPENGAPLAKLRNFEAALGEGSAVDIALIKFCYVDVDADTDAKALFARYQATIGGLRLKIRAPFSYT